MSKATDSSPLPGNCRKAAPHPASGGASATSPKGEGIPKSARDHIHRHVEDLGNLQNRVDVVAGGGGHVVGGAGLAPAVDELAGTGS